MVKHGDIPKALEAWGNPSHVSNEAYIRELQAFLGRKPDKVLECGSGVTTLFIAQSTPHYVSLEHHRDWFARICGELERLQLPNNVQYAELRDGWYDVTPQGPFNLIVVDGPPGGAARRGVFKHRSQFAPGWYMLLDDAQRPAEQETIAAWMQEVPLRVTYKDRFAVLTQVPAISVIMPTISRKQLACQLRLLLAGMESQDEVIVVGDGPQPKAQAYVEGLDDSRVRYMETEKTDTFGASQRDAGVARARGDFFWFVDDDDTITDHAMTEIRRTLRWNVPNGYRVDNNFFQSCNGCAVTTPSIVIPRHMCPEWHPEGATRQRGTDARWVQRMLKMNDLKASQVVWHDINVYKITRVKEQL